MTDEDMKRFWELEKKIDEDIATDDEIEERDILWCEIQREEEDSLITWYQFGY